MALLSSFYAEKVTKEKTCSKVLNDKDFRYPKKLTAFEDYVTQDGIKACTTYKRWLIGSFWKANALHRYVIDHFTAGNYGSQDIILSKLDIMQIYEAVCDVLVHPAWAHLFFPTQCGPFWGSTEYDESYFAMLDEIKKFLKLLINNFPFKNDFRVIYHGSW